MINNDKKNELKIKTFDTKSFPCEEFIVIEHLDMEFYAFIRKNADTGKWTGRYKGCDCEIVRLNQYDTKEEVIENLIKDADEYFEELKSRYITEVKFIIIDLFDLCGRELVEITKLGKKFYAFIYKTTSDSWTGYYYTIDGKEKELSIYKTREQVIDELCVIGPKILGRNTRSVIMNNEKTSDFTEEDIEYLMNLYEIEVKKLDVSRIID